MNRARYYDPRTGRFLSEDPIRFNSGEINFYNYALNNSLVFSDPLGEAPFDGRGDFVNDKLFELGMHINRATTFKDMEIERLERQRRWQEFEKQQLIKNQFEPSSLPKSCPLEKK